MTTHFERPAAPLTPPAAMPDTTPYDAWPATPPPRTVRLPVLGFRHVAAVSALVATAAIGISIGHGTGHHPGTTQHPAVHQNTAEYKIGYKAGYATVMTQLATTDEATVTAALNGSEAQVCLNGIRDTTYATNAEVLKGCVSGMDDALAGTASAI